jgi:hypothetical protein
MTRDRRTDGHGRSRHYVVLTREPDILREIHGFVAALGRKAPR